MKPHPSLCDHVYLGWASSDLAKLLVICPNITMYVLFDLFLSYQMGVIYDTNLLLSPFLADLTRNMTLR